MRGVDSHLSENLEALAHHVRQVLENLREVAARLALDEHGGREEPHVEAGHAHGQVLERILQRQPEVLFVEGLAELRPDRFGHLVGDHLQAGDERVAGLEGPRDQVQRFRESFLERARPLRALHVQEHERQRERRAAAPTRKPHLALSSSIADHAEHHGQAEPRSATRH